jgi:hypothetical protein
MNNADNSDLNLEWDPGVPKQPQFIYNPYKPVRLEDFFEFLEFTGASKNSPRDVIIFKEQFTLE